MTRRTSMEPGAAPARVDRGVEGLGFFAQIEPEPELMASGDEPSQRPGWAETWGTMSREERATQRETWKARLWPLLATMLKTVPADHGVTAAELTDEAMQPTLSAGFGIILPAVPSSDPRAFSFIGPWLAVLAKQGKIACKTARLEGGAGVVQLRREATRDAAHGNDGLIYLESR